LEPITLHSATARNGIQHGLYLEGNTPGSIFRIVNRQRSPLCVRHAVVCEAIGNITYTIRKSRLCGVKCLEKLELVERKGYWDSSLATNNSDPDQVIVSP
jgi:hypothetical protein